jgi:hypothetical protein
MKRTILIVMLALGGTALAQPDVQKRQQVQQQATDLMMQRLTEELQLDPSAQAQVRANWDRAQAQIQGVRKEMWMAMKELKAQLASPTPDTVQLARLSDLILNDRIKVEQIDNDRIRSLRGILTAQQFARAILVSPKIKREVQQQVMQALKQMRAGKGDDVE